ncbi:hypothetical protein D3C85_1584360 [compost metagenome]
MARPLGSKNTSLASNSIRSISCRERSSVAQKNITPDRWGSSSGLFMSWASSSRRVLRNSAVGRAYRCMRNLLWIATLRHPVPIMFSVGRGNK